MSPAIFLPIWILFTGVGVLLNFASKPGFDKFRTIDVLRLTAAGACLGAGISGFAMMWFFRDHR